MNYEVIWILMLRKQESKSEFQTFSSDQSWGREMAPPSDTFTTALLPPPPHEFDESNQGSFSILQLRKCGDEDGGGDFTLYLAAESFLNCLFPLPEN